MKSTTIRYSNLDLLRLFAAVAVVYIHWNAYTNGLNSRPSLLGFDPVPVFVCLSGFLIPGSLESSRSWSHFAWKRVLRVYPAMALSLISVGVLAGWKFVGPTILTYLVAGLITIPMQHNGALWSLMLEELLYASHAITKLRRAFNPKAVWACIAVCFVGWLMLRNGTQIQSSFFRAAISFFVGNLGYLYRERFSKISGWRFAAALVLLMGRYAMWPNPHGMQDWWVIITSPVASFCWLFAALNLPQIRLEFPDLSYGCYVYHSPILHAVMFGDRHDHWRTWLLTLVSTFALSAFSWYCVESQALKCKNRIPACLATRTRLLSNVFAPILSWRLQ